MKKETLKKYKMVADLFLASGDKYKSYQKIYPNASVKTAKRQFYTLWRTEEVEEYVRKKREKHSDKSDITFMKQIKRLDVIIETADKDSDKVNAIKEQNKLLALYGEHNKQKQSVNVPIDRWIESNNNK